MVGDITARTGLPAAALDLIYLSTVVHGFTPEQRRGFVAEAGRLLAPRGRLGGQNKVPTCANDRRYADDLLALVAEGGHPVMIRPPAKRGASGGVGADG